MPRFRSLVVSLALCTSLLALAGIGACDEPPPRIYITSPANGAMIDASSVLVTGTTNQNGTVIVNGSVVPLNPDNSWEVTLPLDQAEVINLIDAQFYVGLEKDAARITVLAGPSVAEGSYSPEGVGLGFTDTGLSSLLPLVSSLAGDSLDITSLLLGGGTLFDDTIFTFDVAATGYDADIGDFDFDASLAPGQIDTTITINGIYLAAEVDINDGIAIDWHCKLEVDMQSAVITAAFSLEPDATVPTQVDVNQLGDVDVTVNGLSFQFIDGPCDPDAPLIGDLVNVLMGDQLEGAIPTGFRDNLKDPDGPGPLDSSIAAGIQEALAGIDIAGEVGNAVGVALDAPFHAITTNSNGIVLNADAAFVASVGTGPGQCDAPYGTIDLTESFVIPSAPPTFGPTAPGGDPYSLGLSISSSAFNQLFKGMVECGLMQIDVTEVEFSGFTLPLTTNIMALLGVPQFQTVLGANTPLVIQIRPAMAPFLTGNPGPNGEMVELGLPHLVMEIVDPATGKKWLLLAIDTRFGLDLAFDPVTEQLAPVVSAPAPGDSVARVLSNAIGANESGVENSIVLILPSFFAAFGDAFGSFPLPTFFGLGVEVVEIESAGGLFKLYTNLVQAPMTRIENVVLTDSSTGDFVTDGVFDTNEWRHKTKVTATPSTIDTRFRSVIAGDACCTLDDEHVNATADYRIEFDVVPISGHTWQLDIAHSILGALTTVDEANALYDGSELAEFTTPIQGAYSVDGGPFVSFDVTPSVWSVFDDFGGAENDLNAEVTGSNSAVITGSTPQHITIDFSFAMHIFSNSNVVFPAIDGGEGAIRLGMHDTIELGTDPSPGFTAGHYPGQGSRDITQDGHFVDIDLTAIPCTGDPVSCPVCGDGVLAGGEGCDDGNGLGGDGCDANCGLEPGYNCGGEPTACLAICGDGLILGIEGCDDANSVDSDGCSSFCQIETDWTCSGEPSSCVPN